MGALVAFVVTLLPAPDRDGIRDLRLLLKIALRRFGLRAVSVTANTLPPRRSAVRCKQRSARRVAKMDMKKFSGNAFLKVDDVRDGPLQERIAGVVMGRFDKPDLIFESGDRLSLNATNNKTLIKAYGADSDDWIGHMVELFLGEIEYQGKPQAAILVRPVSEAESDEQPATEPAKRKKPAKKSPGGEFDDEIQF
jgi:hypothetical protein